jgi:hypothetical protein
MTRYKRCAIQTTIHMKNKQLLFLSLLVTALCAQPVHAQFEKGDVLVNAGISFGLIGYSYAGYGNSSFALPLNASVEFSINENLAVGPYLGYFSRSYSYSSTYRDKFSVMSFGGRLSFHASGFLNEKVGWKIDQDKWDIYGYLFLGYENYKWKYDSDYSGIRTSNNAGRIVLGPVIGGRYFVSERFGLFAEVGRGTFGLMTIGASLKM